MRARLQDESLAVFATDDVAGTNVLAVDGLYAGYGRKQVVYDVSLHVAAGEVVTLLGHNGSGKTTTIKTILGLFPAQGGRVTYQGHDVTRPASAPTSGPGWPSSPPSGSCSPT